MTKYEITMMSGEVRIMTIIDPESTIEEELHKWPDKDFVRSYRAL